MQSIHDFENKLSELPVDIESLENADILKKFCIDVIAFVNDYFETAYSVCFDMPVGYEAAFGLTRDDVKTVYMNLSVGNSISDFVFLFSP